MKKKKGFTLVELLVVIVILAIIMVLAIPGIMSVSKRMKQKGLENKFESIEQAAVVFAQENSNRIKDSLGGECNENSDTCECSEYTDKITGVKTKDCRYQFKMTVEDLIVNNYYKAEKNSNGCLVVDPTNNACLDCVVLTVKIDDDHKNSLGIIDREDYYLESSSLSSANSLGYEKSGVSYRCKDGKGNNPSYPGGKKEETPSTPSEPDEPTDNKTYYTLTFMNESSEFQKITVVSGTTVSFPTITNTTTSIVINGTTINIPTKTEYKFKGWGETSTSTSPLTSLTITSNKNIYAIWAKKDNTMLARGSFKNTDSFWNQSANIKKIVFENSLSPKTNALYTYDLSANNVGTVMGYLVPDTSDNTKYVLYIQSKGKAIANPNSSYYFYNFTALESIEGLSNLDTSKMADMGGMFYKCNSLISLDLSNFDTSKVVNMANVFLNCSSLTSLNISNFNTSIVTDLHGMFWGCSNLTSLDLRNFDTSRVTDMSSMFYNCNSLTSLNLSSFNTSKVTNMESMFHSCNSLTSLNISNFDTSKVTNMSCMFLSCQNLRSLDLSRFDTSNVTNMYYMFGHCNSLTTTITVKGTACTNYEYMFNKAASNSGAKIIVNYTSANKTLVNNMIATKSSGNVVLGIQV